MGGSKSPDANGKLYRRNRVYGKVMKLWLYKFKIQAQKGVASWGNCFPTFRMLGQTPNKVGMALLLTYNILACVPHVVSWSQSQQLIDACL
jgi:hypothetical protein